MAASTVTGNVSVVLVNSSETKVYLSSVGYPGHIVTIKDNAGVASQGTPILVSTTNGVFFADGSISTLLLNPYSYLTISSRTPTQWQILNNQAYLTTLSNAFVETLTAGNAYVSIASTVREYVSSGTIGTVNVTNSLNLAGNVDILGNFIVGGTVDLFSTLDVREDINFSSALTVGGATFLNTSLFVKDELTVGGSISTSGNVIVGDRLFVGSSLYVSATLVPKNLSVQTLTANNLILSTTGSFQLAGGISAGTAFVQGSLSTLSSLNVMSSISILGTTEIQGPLTVQSTFQTNLLSSLSGLFVTGEISAFDARIGGILSTTGSLAIKGNLSVSEQVNASSVVVSGSVSTNNLTVAGNVEISSIRTDDGLNVLGSADIGIALNTSSFQVLQGATHVKGLTTVGGFTLISTSLSTLGNLGVGGDLVVGSTLFVKGTALTSSILNISTFRAEGTVSTHAVSVNNLSVIQDFIMLDGVARARVLGAPINIELSTLSLSNTLTATGSNQNIIIPELEITGNTNVGAFSAGAKGQLGFVNAFPELNIRDSFVDFNCNANQKYISAIRISSLIGTQSLSNFLIGSSNYQSPRVLDDGLLILGLTTASIPATNNPSIAQIATGPPKFSGSGRSAFFNSGTQWMAVGEQTFGSPTTTIYVSSNSGLTWTASPGGFGTPSGSGAPKGYDITYASTIEFKDPRWFATGTPSQASGISTVLASADGYTWSNAYQPKSGFSGGMVQEGRKILYSYPDTAYTPVLLLGGMPATPAGFEPAFGISYSYDGGSSWGNASPSDNAQFNCYDIVEANVGGNRWHVAVGESSGFKKLYRSSGISSWTALLTTPTGTTKTIACSRFGIFVIGGEPSFFGGPTTSISWTLDVLSTTTPTFYTASSGGFSVRVNKIIFDSNTDLFYAVGSNAGGSNLQYSSDGSNWTTVPYVFDGELFGIAPGAVYVADTGTTYFVANVETRFQTGISTQSIILSSITASSITAQRFIGDGSQLSNSVNFISTMGVSSIQASFVNIKNDFTLLTGDVINTSTLIVNDRATRFLTSRQSTFPFTLAVGISADSNKNTQYTQNGIRWFASSNPTFEYFGESVAGNSNKFPIGSNITTTQSFFVATGGDSRTEYTIQWSENGLDWYPVETGGFSIADDTDIKYGTTVNYFQTQGGYRWLVGGSAPGSQETIFYSEGNDGKNFYPATGQSGLLCNSIIKIKSVTNEAFALNENGYLAYSSNGLFWDFSFHFNPFSAFGYGATPSNSGWFAFTPQGSVYKREVIFFDSWNEIVSNTFVYNAIDLVYSGYSNNGGFKNDGVFIVLTSNMLYLTSTFTDFRSVLGIGNEVNSFESLIFNPYDQLWYLGAQSSNQNSTIFTSVNGLNWNPILDPTGRSGFSSATINIGAGYAVTYAPGLVLAGGIGSYNRIGDSRPQILQVAGASNPPTATISTIVRLTQANGSNVFQSNVYGLSIDATSSILYNYIAVGDGEVPQKTIARSLDGRNWLPAVTGGFSPAGYDAMLASNLPLPEDPTQTYSLWFAVGKAVASTATIQYSPDGANWFATNNSAGIPLGGRGIARLSQSHPTNPGRFVVVGEAPIETQFNKVYKTIIYSDDGFNWCNLTFPMSGFNPIAYDVARGIVTPSSYPFEGFIAVGDARSGFPPGCNDPLYSTQYSFDGENWFYIGSLGSPSFDIAGYGVAYGDLGGGSNLWVAVGQNSNGSNILYSSNPYTSGWSYASAGARFPIAGYGVTFDSTNKVFVAVGPNQSNTQTVLYSSDGNTWNTLSASNSGFLSEEIFGTAFGFFGQSLIQPALLDLVEMPNFRLYQRDDPLFYPVPTVRLLSTQMIFNEAVILNLSSQIMVNSNAPYSSNTTVTVQGNVQTSTLVYLGTEPPPQFFVSSLVVSTIEFYSSFIVNTLVTPSIGFFVELKQGQGVGNKNLANVFEYYSPGANTDFNIFVNSTINVTSVSNADPVVGINANRYNSNIEGYPRPILKVGQTTACSTFSTVIFKQPLDVTISANNTDNVYIEGSNIAIFGGVDSQAVTGKNTIYCDSASNIIFNDILCINKDSQKVGVYTTNPEFDFDVRSAGYISNLTTSSVVTKAIFYTLQSF